MKIVPFGKWNGQNNRISIFSNLLGDEELSFGDTEEDGTFEAPMESQSTGKTKIDDVQLAIEKVVGEPSIDNLMIILAAIGMSKISIQVNEDGSHLSVSGIIDFTEPDSKISKKE
jgi:hypothetical protein